MKKILLLFFLFCTLSSSAQLFKGLGFYPNRSIGAIHYDSISQYLYVGGAFNDIAGQPTTLMAYYDGTTWNTLNYAYSGGSIQAIATFKGDIYFGGTKGIRKWDGIKVDSLGKTNGVDKAVFSLFNWKDSLLIVVGSFQLADDSIPVKGIATWDGLKWDTFKINVPLLGSSNDFRCVAYYKGEFYFGGNFSRTNSPYGKDIIRYDGSKWKDVGGGLKGDCWINDMEVYKDELYIVGEFKKADGNADNHIMKWNGQEWKEVGGGFDYQAFDLITFKNELFACGTLEHAGGVQVKKIAKWDGNQWCGYLANFNNNVFNVEIYKDTLVFGDGYFNVPNQDQLHLLTDPTLTDSCGVINSLDESQVEIISILPNPVIDYLTIEFDFDFVADFKVLSLYGVILEHGTIEGTNARIDLGKLNSGYYIFIIESKSSTITHKFLKQ
ncbi:MAG: T9SS type A sorting domain-containing protein [Flavobacteriales bacterium]|nr:T9SS type A sorting domain-containing protein [Flavobacteriales bacterium]